jgi:hypothetical protein
LFGILLTGASAFAQELVVNGGFETGDFTGWTASGHTSGIRVFSANTDIVYSGNFGAALGFGGGIGFLSQNLATTAGQTYVLSFWFNSIEESTPNEFNVSWNGVVIFDQVNIPEIGWTNLLFTNTATGTSTTVQFGFRDDSSYLGLDDVSVMPGAPVIPPVTPPTNDNFSKPLVITAPFYQTATTNNGATREANEPDHGAPFFDNDGDLVDPGGEGNRSVWWTFTAPNDGYVNLTVAPSTFTPLIAVYKGTTFNNLSAVVTSSEAWGVPGQLQDFLADNVHFNVLSNVVYHIAVDGYAQSQGAFTLTSQFIAAPTNNYFASRIALPQFLTNAITSNLGANLEPNEPTHSPFQAGASLWWSWQPHLTGQSGPVTLTTEGSSFDTLLEVYTGTNLSNLVLVTNNDNAFDFGEVTNGPEFDLNSRVTFNAQPGITYQVCVSGINGGSGEVVLNNVVRAITNITLLGENQNPDGSVDFSVNLDLLNLLNTSSSVMRISLYAQPGYNYQSHVATDYQFLTSLNVPKQLLGMTNAALFAANGSATVKVAGTCPAPFYYTNTPSFGSDEIFGVGYTIIAVLEEQVIGGWVARDSRPIFVGNFPPIQDFQGLSAGVITLDSALTSSSPLPTFLQINFGPPAAARLGGLWRFSPTNDGTAGEFRFYTNFFARTNVTLVIQSTNFSVEMASLPGFNFVTNSHSIFSPGAILLLNLFYNVDPPNLLFNRTNGLGMTGTVGTAYQIQTANKISNDVTWTAITNNLLAIGTNWVANTSPSTVTNHFYRALWLSN